MACGGHTVTNLAVIEQPQAPKKYTGEVIDAMRPGPNGPYRVKAKLDEALDKGWTVLTDITAGLTELGGGWYELPDGTKVQGAAKARSALNKARGPGGHK